MIKILERGKKTHALCHVWQLYESLLFGTPGQDVFSILYRHSINGKSPVSVWKARSGGPLLDLQALLRGLWQVCPKGHHHFLPWQVLAFSAPAWVQLSGDWW